MKKQIIFDKVYNGDCFDDISRKIYYCSDKITDYSIIYDDNNIKGIDIEVADAVSSDELSDIEHNVAYMINEYVSEKQRKPKIVFQNNVNISYNNIYEEMIASGKIIEMGNGLIAFSGYLLDAFNYIDKLIIQILDKKFQYEHYQYPTLIKTKTLEQCGYFDSHINQSFFATHLENNLDNYLAFKESYKTNKSDQVLSFCESTEYSLPPTMCYHTYQQLKDSNILHNMVITSKGKSFRYESKYAVGLERLFDFTIREIVFFGEDKFVKDAREEIIQSISDIIIAHNLNGNIESANDPFFLDENIDEKVMYQKGMRAKYELRLNVDLNKTIAVGSFNLHNEFFGKKFNIRDGNGSYIKSSCVGFGLERFAYAFTCQNGVLL